MSDMPKNHTDNHDNTHVNEELTVKQVANIIEETPNVLRNWIKELKTYIPLKKNSSGYNVFDKNALEVVKQIKHLHRERNYSIKQIEHYFATGGESYTPLPEKTNEEELADELREIKERLASQEEQNRKQNEFNQALLARLEEQQQYIESRIQERDEKLMKGIREIQETKKLETQKEKAPWWKFWE